MCAWPACNAYSSTILINTARSDRPWPSPFDSNDDIAAIAKPLTKLAVTVLEPAQVPGVFQQAFHLMRSGRPGPVLIDLPFDVQMTEIEFDPDTYTPLPVYKPAASRAQVEKALDMLSEAERPIIVAGAPA